MSDLLTVEKGKKEVKKLRALNEELENYFRNTIIPQLFIDADLVLRKFSPPANTHFKLTSADNDKTIQDIPTLADLPGLIESIKEVILTNNDLEKEIQTPDKRWFQMNILPYIIKKENITNGVVITFVDISAHINDKMDIEKINADHETFIYSVTHDLKGPLNNLAPLIDMLKSALDKNDREDINDLIDKIEGLASSMKTIITELTDLTKVSEGANNLPDAVDIEAILAEVKFTLKSQIYQSNAKISADFLIPTIQFSRKNLRSILYNLLSNAIKFSLPEIKISTKKEGAYTLLSVKDNGVGIEEEKHEEIFSKFTRLRPEIEGTGVGLFLISKMISNQGGKIEVQSKINEGTTFNIYLKN